MASLIDVLRQDHADLTRRIDVFERQIAFFGKGDEPDYEVIRCVLEYCLDYPDQCHHPKEDLIYRRLAAFGPDADRPVADLQAEHETLAALTRRIADTIDQVLQEAEIPRSRVDAAAREFLAAYRHHMESEEKVFFPAALSRLDARDWAVIDAEMTTGEDPLFGEITERRFAALRQYVLDTDAQNDDA